jgi:hypothetical protein
MYRACKFIDVDKIFMVKSNEGAIHVMNALKLCMYWKIINEYVMRIHKKVFHVNLYEGNMFGSIMAFIRRCKDLYEICQANGQLFSTFSGQEEGKVDNEQQISRIYLEYSKLLSNISQVRHQSLDIKDDELGAYFDHFRREMHNIDSMILDALKASFEGVANIKEQCEILDTFHSMSDRARVKDTYYQRADAVGKQLYNELSRLIHGAKQRLNYTKMSYSALTVNFIRACGLIQRGNSVIDDVTSSNVFLGDAQKLKSINRIRTPLNRSLENMLGEFRKNNHFLDRMEVSFKLFLVTRSAGFEGALDININRDFPVIPFTTRMLECLGLQITASRAAQFLRQDVHKTNITVVARLVTEYNTFFACRLSTQEKGIFRSKVLNLERRIWNGIYKTVWAEQTTVPQWCKMCEETIWQLTREIIEYKTLNASIQVHLNDVKGLKFVKIDDLGESYEPDKFCKVQFNQIHSQVDLVRARCSSILLQIKKIKHLLDINEEEDENLQWTNYNMALADCLAGAIVDGLAISLKVLATLLHTPQNKPIIKIYVTLTNKVLTVDSLGKDVCLFLDSYKLTALNALIRAIPDKAWAAKVGQSIEDEPELVVVEKILQNEVEISYINVQKYLHTLNPIKDFWTLQPDNVLEYYKEECTDVDSFLKDLTKLKNVSEVASAIFKKKWVNFFLIDATSFLRDIITYCKTWEKEFIQILCTLVDINTDESQSLLSDLSALIATGEIQGKEEFMDQTLDQIETNTKDTIKVLKLLQKNGINTKVAFEATKDIESQYMAIKKDKNQILLQRRDASMKTTEQMKHVKLISKALDDLIVSYKVQAPYTSSWKSEEALTEIDSFSGKMTNIIEGVEDYDIKDNIENFDEKIEELESNLANLRDIWMIVTDWENFEKQANEKIIQDLDVEEMIRGLNTFNDKVAQFSSRTFDSRIEIHLTLQNKLSIYEGNFSLIETFRSKAIKDRHWDFVSRACGFDAIQDGELVINGMPLEDFMNLGLERQSTEIKTIIGKAQEEYKVEEHLSNVMQSLTDICFKYKTSSSGIRVITNDVALQELIGNITKSIAAFKESDASEPFLTQIDSLDIRLTETKKKIDLIKKVESIFNIVSEVSNAYSLDLQLGKFQQKLSILTEIWKNIHQDISEHSDLVEAMNDENLEGNLWSFEQEMTLLENRLMTFLGTRKFVFPKFALCSSEKIKSVFCSRSVDNFCKWISLLFPHVLKIIVKKETNMIVGYLTKTGFQRTLATPLCFDWSTDFIACKLQEGLRLCFRDEISQNMVILAKKNLPKQDTKYNVLPMQTTFVIRHLAFCSEFQRTFNDAAQQQKHHVLDMLVQQNNRVNVLATMVQEAKTEEGSLKCNDAVGIEVAMKQVMERFVELIFGKDEERHNVIKAKWSAMLKYAVASKDPFDIQVNVLDKQLMYGFDETAKCDAMLLMAFREDALSFIGKLLSHTFGSVLDGPPFAGKFTSMKCFSQILGRHLVPLAHFDYSMIEELEALLFSMEGSQDFVCFHHITSEYVYNRLFTVVLAYHMKVNEYKSVLLNRVASMTPEKFTTRIFYLTTFPTHDLLYVGKEYRVVSISPINQIQVAQFALLAENFSATLKLIQLVVICLTVVSHKTKHNVHFTLKDMRTFLRRARSKIDTLNASSDEAIIGSILEAYPIDKKFIANMFRDTVNTAGMDRLIEIHVLDSQVEYCNKNQITLTPNFKSMLHDITYSLVGGNHILLYGGPVTQKTTLWKVATSAFNFETVTVSNLALEPNSEGKCDMKHIPLLEKRQGLTGQKDLLLVLECELNSSIHSTLLSLLEHDTYILRDNGQLAVKERQIRVVLETGKDLSSLTPALAAFFHLHNCHNEDVTWNMTLASKIYKLANRSALIMDNYAAIQKSSNSYVEFFLNIRETLDLRNDKVTQDAQMNSLIGFFSSIVGQETSLDVEDLQQMMIYACVFCFSQDVPIETRQGMEIKVRELYECRYVPTELSIFDYYYDAPSKAWRPLRTHPLCSKNPQKGPILLRNHLKQEIIARMMVKNLVSVDIQGECGVGKTTIVQNLIKTFNTSDFLGVAVPSCKGTALSKITSSMLNCIKQHDEGSSQSEDLSDQAQQSSGVRRNALFCIDDVDACGSKLSQFIKFFTEHRTWLGKNGVVSYTNQVLVTTRLKTNKNQTPFHSVKINIDPIEGQELINIFKTSLKEKFLQFELDIQFLITKVIMASVDINKIFVEANVSRVYFHVQDNMKIITGLMRAHKDCHDTKFELLELWVNEVYRAYFEKIPQSERSMMYDKVSGVMLHYFGDEAKELLEESHDSMIGDFLDPYNFYTTIELPDLKNFVLENIEKVNQAIDWKLNIIPNKTTLMQVCQLLRALSKHSGQHMLMYGSSVISPMSLVELICKIRHIRFFKLLNTDIYEDKWKKKFRSITKICGLDKVQACLYVPLDLFDKIIEVRACLESFIDIGYDLSLFQVEELEIMCQKQGYFLELSQNTKKNFHCVVVGNTFEQVETHFSNEKFFVSNTGQYEDHLLEYAEELVKEPHGIALEVFKEINENAHEFLDIIAMPDGMRATLSSYVCFMNIFNQFIHTTLEDFEAILNKIQTIEAHIGKHFDFSTEQMLILEKNREKSKSIVADHQAMTMKHIQTKKELKEIEGHMADGMNEYGDEQAAMLRLNMAIVEERTCQWSLFQRALRDFDDAVLDESNTNDFINASENFADVKGYLTEWRVAFDLDEEEDFCVKFKFLLNNILEVYDVKSLWQVGENEELHLLKEKIYQEVSEGSIILFSILRIHSRIEIMSKSTKNIQTKEQKLQTLQKKCKSIEDKLKNLRQQNKSLEKRLQDEMVHIEEHQANIALQNETINSLEHSTTEHKNLKQPLDAFLDLLGKMKARMLDEKVRLPGSTLLAAASCGYCGCLSLNHRNDLIKIWKGVLNKAGVAFKDDFIPYIMSTILRSQVAVGEALIAKQNLAILSALKDPILVIDPLQISLEYIELLHADDKITMLHIGDPTFKTQFITEARDSNVIIVTHSTLDLNRFASQIELQKVKLTNKGLSVYHVTPSLKVNQLVYIQPSQIISFDLDKEDIAKYVHNRLQLLIPDKARYYIQSIKKYQVLQHHYFRSADAEGDGNTIATEKDRLDIELEDYIGNNEQVCTIIDMYNCFYCL